MIFVRKKIFKQLCLFLSVSFGVLHIANAIDEITINNKSESNTIFYIQITNKKNNDLLFTKKVAITRKDIQTLKLPEPIKNIGTKVEWSVLCSDNNNDGAKQITTIGKAQTSSNNLVFDIKPPRFKSSKYMRSYIHFSKIKTPVEEVEEKEQNLDENLINDLVAFALNKPL